RQSRRRRIFLSATFVILLAVIAVIATLWKSEVSQAERAEASKLLALGRTKINEDPTEALAYAIASLRKVDTQAGRHFALEALWKGPPVFIDSEWAGAQITYLSYSPDGKWLAGGGLYGVGLRRQDGKQTITLEQGVPMIHLTRSPQFSPDS